MIKVPTARKGNGPRKPSAPASSAPAGPLILDQISRRLSEIFKEKIDLSDLSKKPEDQKTQFFVSRSFAALCCMGQLNCSADEAADCVTDGGADDGIDAMAFDQKAKKIYLCQSKWRKDLSKGVELTDFTRLRDGTRNLLKLNWYEGNKNLQKFKAQFEAMLSDIDTSIVLVIAHTSEQPIAANIRDQIDQFLEEANQYNNDLLSFKEFRLPDASRVARSQTRPESINLQVMLQNWGRISEPFKAFYGSLAALDAVKWFEQHDIRLFAENLRIGLDTPVNDTISLTAEKEGEKFWYYNNGITAICDSVEKTPHGGADTTSGLFEINKISVINGAQTITSLSRAKQNGAKLQNVRVHFRIIALENTPEDFAAAVTTANNTQNNLGPLDFLATDVTHDRIRKEARRFNISYTYRRGEKDPEPEEGFSVRSATIAAACASGDLRLAALSKRYIGGLWENTKKEPYTRLFNESTTAAYLWTIVRIMNTVDKTLESAANKIGRQRLVAIHGNRFILFYVFNKLNIKEALDDTGFIDAEKRAIRLTKSALTTTTEVIEDKFKDAYPANVFKNQDRQQELLDAVDAKRKRPKKTSGKKH